MHLHVFSSAVMSEITPLPWQEGCSICLNCTFHRSNHQSFQLGFSPPIHMFLAMCFPSTRPPRLGEALEFSPSHWHLCSDTQTLAGPGDSHALTKAWESCSFERNKRLPFFFAPQSFFASQSVEEVFEVKGFLLLVHFKVSKYSFSNCVVLGAGYWLIKNQHWSLLFF